MEKLKSEYQVWLNILRLCQNEEIEIDQNWRVDFMAFYRIMGEKPEGSVLTRVESEWGFIPGNCIWAFPLGSELIKEKRKLKSLNKVRQDSLTGVTGVTWNSDKTRWWARIRVDGKQKHLLFSKDQTEAIKARLQGEIEHYGEIQQKEFAHLLQ